MQQILLFPWNNFPHPDPRGNYIVCSPNLPIDVNESTHESSGLVFWDYVEVVVSVKQTLYKSADVDIVYVEV